MAWKKFFQKRRKQSGISSRLFSFGWKWLFFFHFYLKMCKKYYFSWDVIFFLSWFFFFCFFGDRFTSWMRAWPRNLCEISWVYFIFMVWWWFLLIDGWMETPGTFSSSFLNCLNSIFRWNFHFIFNFLKFSRFFFLSFFKKKKIFLKN